MLSRCYNEAYLRLPGSQKRTRDGQLIVRVDPASFGPVFDSFEAYLGKHPSYIRELTPVKELMDRFQESCQSTPRTFVRATDFNTVQTAADAVEVTYDRDSLKHVWQLKESDELSDGQLSAWAGQFPRSACSISKLLTI